MLLDYLNRAFDRRLRAVFDGRFNDIDTSISNLKWKIFLAAKSINQGVSRMSQEFDALKAQVKANTDAEAAAVVLINGIADRIAAAGEDPVALSALSADLKASADALSAAVVANTPVAPAA